MVVECPICSKVLNNEEICSYCGTNINEDIFTDFTSFQKLKNSFSGTFGKGLSKNDKKDLNEFLLNNESKIAGFISKYQSSLEIRSLGIETEKKSFNFSKLNLILLNVSIQYSLFFLGIISSNSS